MDCLLLVQHRPTWSARQAGLDLYNCFFVFSPLARLSVVANVLVRFSEGASSMSLSLSMIKVSINSKRA